jgi:hypothetical protein
MVRWIARSLPGEVPVNARVLASCIVVEGVERLIRSRISPACLRKIALMSGPQNHRTGRKNDDMKLTNA